MVFRTPVGRARGLGSAQSGFRHWWMQRVTAVALIPLTLWLGVAIAALPGASYSDVVGWVGEPVNAIFLMSLVVATCYHAALGLQVVVEDYVHSERVKIGTIMVLNLLFALAVLVAFYAFLRIAFLG